MYGRQRALKGDYFIRPTRPKSAASMSEAQSLAGGADRALSGRACIAAGGQPGGLHQPPAVSRSRVRVSRHPRGAPWADDAALDLPPCGVHPERAWGRPGHGEPTSMGDRDAGLRALRRLQPGLGPRSCPCRAPPKTPPWSSRAAQHAPFR